MKAFVLAAGLGTRLKPLTDRVPKCLLPIRDTPLLGIWLDLCRQHGITDVLVNAHSHAGMVKEYAAKSKAGLSIRVSEEETLLEVRGHCARTTNGLRRNENFLCSTATS
jgi:mannose-1-phosphate guanylyltransferase